MSHVQITLDGETHTHNRISYTVRRKRAKQVNAMIELRFPRVEAQLKIDEYETEGQGQKA